jgi:hemolysin activation/secretion protein
MIIMNKSTKSFKVHVSKSLIAACALALSPWSLALAEVTPDTGAILQQLQPVAPAQPSSNDTGLKLETPSHAKLPMSEAFQVNVIIIVGNHDIETSVLQALLSNAIGTKITLPELDALATRITDYYHSHGYPLARAYIPAQSIASGIVRIEVLEAHYGTINLENHSLVKDSLLQSTLAPLKSGQSIVQNKMDRALLLLSDIPGVSSMATLKPGAEVGSSDLDIKTEATPLITGNLSTDNYGNRYNGRVRGGATVNVNNALHIGDVLSLSGMSAGENMNYGRFSYEALLNGQGSRLGASYFYLDYALGDSLQNLNAYGTAQIASAWLKHPLLRGRELNFFGQLQYDHAQLNDTIGISDIQTYRHVDSGTATINGDSRDNLLKGATNTWNASWTGGQVSFDNSAAQQADASTKNSQGLFSKVNLNLSRLQNITEKTGIYASFAGQWAQDNLDSSKKMTVGGPYTVRAYDMGVLSADTGYLGTVELRQLLAEGRFGLWQAVGFVDSAQVTINQSTWTAGTNKASLSGAGGGINWLAPKTHWLIPTQLHARAYIATPIGSVPSLVGSTSSTRAWLEFGVGF